MTAAGDVEEVYRRLEAAYGPQSWWPADTPFEVMIGAVLVQHTAWGNVERVIANLRAAGHLAPARLAALPLTDLEVLIRPSGTYRQKALTIRRLLEAIRGLDVDAFLAQPAPALRHQLLAVPGIGRETADSILLYAAGHPVFVVDAYARRILGRVGIVAADLPYPQLQACVEARLPRDARLLNEFHALLVRHGKNRCRTTPACAGCCLLAVCVTGRTLTGLQPVTSTTANTRQAPDETGQAALISST